MKKKNLIDKKKNQSFVAFSPPFFWFLEVMVVAAMLLSKIYFNKSDECDEVMDRVFWLVLVG